MTGSKEKQQVLLASQSSLLSKSIEKLLEHHYDLIVVEDAESAWKTLAENRQIVLVMSELAVVLEPFALIERIRQASDERLAATPLILLHGEKDTREHRQKAFQQGASDFVALPTTREELIDRVELQIQLFSGNPALISADNEASAAGALKKLAQISFFDSRVDQELAFSQRHRSNLSICHLKIDGIKSLAEQHGKDALQGFVKGLINIILQSLRTEDLLCYLGNAEFHILYPATNGIGAMTAVKRILERIAASHINVSGKQMQTTLSASLYSCVAGQQTSLENIYQQLSEDLQQAVAAGGNQVVSSFDSSGPQTFSIDRVLKLIDQDNADDVDEHMVALLLQALPLFEYGDAVLDLELLDTLAELRKRLKKQTNSPA